MSDSFYISTAGAAARLKQLDIVANNLANMATSGFKSDRVVFDAALEGAIRSLDGTPAPGATGHVFGSAGASHFDPSRGSAVQTGRGLDAAIDGLGYFVVETPDGVRYTRAGSFNVSPVGELVTPSGDPVLGEGGPITVGSEAARIQADGSVVGDSGAEFGKLQVVEFSDPAQLEKVGDAQFRAPADVVDLPVESPLLLPGAIEGSNVDPTRELATLMILQRSYEAAMQVMRSEDESVSRLLQEFSQ
ncbi:MAG: flagellar basal-body rod protein FlgF [Myxococcales bacterium]|nr:flagellar basal-body rod protein FlgF [Myxococcales bacterium]